MLDFSLFYVSRYWSDPVLSILLCSVLFCLLFRCVGNDAPQDLQGRDEQLLETLAEEASMHHSSSDGTADPSSNQDSNGDAVWASPAEQVR